jgi:hypothetical protein
MTPEEARSKQNWRGMDGTTAFHLIERHADNWSEIGMMMDAWLEANQKQNSIAQAIRDAAVNWPHFLGDVENGILDAFFASRDYWKGATDVQKRTFMLLVAEALES